MALKKIGSPEKINVVGLNGALSLDPHLAAKRIKETWTAPTITIDQLHEKLKSLGVVDYSSEDMSKIINLLNSTGLKVQQ
jgi:hypothetical protein